MRSARAPLLLSSLALALASGGRGLAEVSGERLDLTAVSDALDAGAATAGTPAAVRAYDRLDRFLARHAPRGLPDDLGMLRAAARACAGPLAGDADLRDAVRDALGQGGTNLRGLDAAVLGAAGDLQVEGHRDRVLGAAARARGLERDGELELSLGNDAKAAGLLRGSGLGFARAARKAETLLARETPRKPVFDVPVLGRAGALMGVWGEPGPEPRIYAVGAGDSAGPQFLVLHPGAEGWVRMPVAASGDLWWVAAVPGDGVWACGTGGRVVRYDPASGAMEDRSTGVDATLYGLWGSGPAGVWAVGGDPAGVGPRPALLHWDGGAWSPVVPPAAAADRMLYKVWGAAADDVWAVGEEGVLLHFDGEAWSADDSGTASTLLTVAGPDPLVAVGGGAAATVVERGGGGTWSEVPVTGVNAGDGSQFPGPVLALNGVFSPAMGAPMAVGFARTVLRRGADGWTGVAGVPSAVRDLHAVWIDDDGDAVMVGGKLSSLTEGQIVTYGKRRLPSDVVPQSRFRGAVADLLYTTCAHSACHLPPFSNAEFALDTPETSYASVVSVPSTQSPLLRVSPGRPSQSYLWHKVGGTQETVGGSGDRMPVLHQAGDDYLSDEEMDLLRGWILDGARDN